MQVPEGGEDLVDVRDRVCDRQRRAVVRGAVVVEDATQALAAHVLHDDVAIGAVLDEVVDVDDVVVIDLDEEAELGERGRQHVGVAGVEQALQHDPAVFELVVTGEIDPTEPTMGEAAHDLVPLRRPHDVMTVRASA